ncbi:MAG: glycosyltransferase family 4 protein [Saprospiraceae bacterium]|nr:glycosyltransferase family 4 protein [Saprospiraceae bacterium]
MTKVKIAVNTRFLLSGQLEGFGWYTHEIMKRMVLNHPDDEFYFLFDRPFDPRFIYGKNVTPVVIFPPARHPLLFHWWFEYSAPKVLKQYQAEVFFSPDSMCSLRTKVPTVMTCHDLVPLHMPEQIAKRHRSYLIRMLPQWLNRADHVLTVSDFVKQDIASTCHINPDKIHTVHNGCREDFKPLGQFEQQKIRQQFSDDQAYFFYAGAIHPRKNVHRLIRAFDQFKTMTKAPVKLLLAGRFAWQTGEVLQAWEQASHQKDIKFLGYVEELDLPRLTAAALASVYVSLSEGFGLPLIEAMACQTPVMTSDGSCLPEIAGDAALYVDPLDVLSISSGLQQLYEDQQLRSDLVQAGKQRSKLYNWDEAAARIYAVIKQAAGK